MNGDFNSGGRPAFLLILSRAACIFAARPILSSRCFSRRSRLLSRRSSTVSSVQRAVFSAGGMIFFPFTNA